MTNSNNIKSDFWQTIHSKVRVQHKFPEIMTSNSREDFPLSFSQERLWKLDNLFPGSCVHNTCSGFRLIGKLDIKAFQDSLLEIIKRHDILRTIFPSPQGYPIQIITPNIDYDFQIVNLKHLSQSIKESTIQEIIDQENTTPFSLKNTHPHRSKLLHLSDEEHIFLRTCHHIISDGWSYSIFMRELKELYTAFSVGKPSPLPTLNIQYKDYAKTQRKWLEQQDVISPLLSYWKRKLEGIEAPLKLPVNFSQSSQIAYEGSNQLLFLSKDLTDAFTKLSYEEGVSLYTLLLSAFYIFLYQYSGQENMIICSPIAGRYQNSTKKLIGYFNNLLVLRICLSENLTFRQFISRVSKVVLEASNYQYIPFQKIASLPNLSSIPLTRGIFALQNFPSLPKTMGGIKIIPIFIKRKLSNFDFSLFMKKKEERLQINFIYKTELMDLDVSSSLMEDFNSILEKLVLNPELKLNSIKSIFQFTKSRKTENESDSSNHHTVCLPKNEIESRLVESFKQILNSEIIISTDDNFFDLGGHSLLALQLISKIETEFSLSISLHLLFQYPTVIGLAKVIEHLIGIKKSDPIENNVNQSADNEFKQDLSLSAAKLNIVLPAVSVHASKIFLTGSTGFLGAYLLKELLNQTDADIFCLTRSKNQDEGKNKIRENFSFYSFWKDSFNHRVFSISGDLELPLFGMNINKFLDLAKEIDVIYHNAASVNLLYPYNILRNTNVLGTLEVLKLASLKKIKPLNFVSTLGIFSINTLRKYNLITEKDFPLVSDLDLRSGYVQSKWISEKIIKEASSRGIPVCIYRPGLISGDSKSGIFNKKDLLYKILKTSIYLGAIPNADESNIIDWSPVDCVAKAIVCLSTRKSHSYQVYHLNNPFHITFKDFKKWLVDSPYKLTTLPHEFWIDKIHTFSSSSENKIPYSIFSYITNVKNSQSGSKSVKAKLQVSHSSKLIFNSKQTQNMLVSDSICYPPLDKSLLSTYFSYISKSTD